MLREKHGKETLKMIRILLLFTTLLAVGTPLSGASPQQRIKQVADTPGLIAFWDFKSTEDGKWSSRHDNRVVKRSYPVTLRRIGDPNSYTQNNWPYKDEKSKLTVDSSGPLGHAVHFNKGYIFAEVPRSEFDKSPLDIHGRQPFTLIAWTKFTGKRHLVAGIWDEGGWNKYGGRRQIALFGGLFRSRGVIGHISATGASSYPQSKASGAQYARCRAIDGRGFKNDQWVALAMTFDPATSKTTVYYDGVATPNQVTDPVAKSVFQNASPAPANPYHFAWPIYSPRAFVLKFNGYDVGSSGVYEHWLRVDTTKGALTYDRSCQNPSRVKDRYQVAFEVKRSGDQLLEPLVFPAEQKKTIQLPRSVKLKPGDVIYTSLNVHKGDDWERVGKVVRYEIREGAPFTFGRALGLGKEPVDHGTELAIDGVAVFNRVLTGDELKRFAFQAER